MVINAHREHWHLHRYLHAAAEAREQRPSRDSAVPTQRASPEAAGPVAASSFASVRVTERARLREVAAPGWRRASQAAIAWAVGYGSLRIYWALGAAPSPPPTGTDLVVFTGWRSVALCGAAVVVVLGLRRARWRRPLAVTAWGMTVALVAASALLLLDVVGIILPGIGLAVHPVAVLSRAACLAGGVLVGATALSYQRHWRCLPGVRPHGRSRPVGAAAQVGLSPPGGTGRRPTGGVRVGEADPRRLGVHAAISVLGVPDEVPPEYVPRDIDAAEFGIRARVAAAAQRGGFVLLVGGSSVGKPRCAVEAVKAMLPDWWLVRPAGPAEVAALAASPSPRMVVWLDELQRYFDGEHALIGAAVWALLNALRRQAAPTPI